MAQVSQAIEYSSGTPFLPGASASYRAITGMVVNGIFEGYRRYDEHNVTPLSRSGTAFPPLGSLLETERLLIG